LCSATASAAAGQAIRNQEVLEQKFDDTLSAIFDVQIGITSLEQQQKGGVGLIFQVMDTNYTFRGKETEGPRLVIPR
jgi:hypothetical protein